MPTPKSPEKTVADWLAAHPKFTSTAQERDYNFQSRWVGPGVELVVRRVLLEAVYAGHKKVWLRVDPPRKLGAKLPASRHWEDGEPTKRILSGTAVLDPSAWRLLGGYLAAFPGSQIHAVTGKLVKKGEDIGESLIRDAVVVAA